MTPIVLFLVLIQNDAKVSMAADPAELLGKWELIEAALGMPAGTIWDFRGGGELVVSVKDRSLSIKYERKGKILLLEIKGLKDSTQINALTSAELELRDADGGAVKFKRAK